MRYNFITDGDCHWYLLPTTLNERFSELLDNGEEDYYCEFNNTFDQYRCDSPSNYTFENPE